MVNLTTLVSAAALALVVHANRHLYLVRCGQPSIYMLAIYEQGAEPGKQQKPDSSVWLSDAGPEYDFERKVINTTVKDPTSVIIEIDWNTRSREIGALADYGNFTSGGNGTGFPCYKDDRRVMYPETECNLPRKTWN